MIRELVILTQTRNLAEVDGILVHPDDKIKLDVEYWNFYHLSDRKPLTHFVGLRIHESPHVEPGKPQLVWKHLS